MDRPRPSVCGQSAAQEAEGSQALSAPPVVRRAARALVVDRSKRLLLFRGEQPDRAPWFAPGGAVELGETYEAALIRELREETGIAVDPAMLSAPVWTRDCLFTWKGVVERHLEHFYVVPIEHNDIDTSGLDPAEAGVIRDHRWWTLAEIGASSEQFAPRRLAEHLALVLDGKTSQEPVEVGE
jgi:ADP-ribose pyrophosphatase YjhB (NUDIX family)